MKIWLAYRFTGADIEELRKRLELIRSSFAAIGMTVVTMIQDIQNWEATRLPKAEVVRRAYELMPSCDGCVCIYHDASPSEGRGWDAGFFAALGKPTVMALRDGIALPYHEALFTENSSNVASGWPSIIRYDDLGEIAPSFWMKMRRERKV
ncbi:MAG: nucleoside 2-deoxyribosyltransferase [Patescibacteria group bacterium]|nr:nucleoside 2-deoxyribosyltransferase [Patescibacteria group bacterium]